MVKRALWLGIGLAVGGLVVRAVSKKAAQLTPRGMAGSAAQSASGLVGSMRAFVDDVREGMAEREAQIHAAFAEGHAIDADPTGDDELNGYYPQRDGYR
jgi:hypothetical protein